MFRNSSSHNVRQHRRALFSVPLLTLILSLFLIALPDARAVVHVTLVWDPNSEPELAGYKLYCGTSPRNYSVGYDAGNVNSYTIGNLQEGKTYYFAATAYDRHGNESAFSEEVVYGALTVNNAPVASNGVLTTSQDKAATGTLGAADPDDNTLTFSVVTQGSLGTVAITNAATGAYTYTPKAGVNGSDSFTFRATDAGGLSGTAAVAVTIVALNHAPLASNGSLSTPQGTPGSGVLIATDPDGDVLSYAVATLPVKGTVVITNAAAGSYTYTPNAGAIGADSFTFRVRDPAGLTSSASVAVTIASPNHAPVAGNGTLNTVRDAPAAGKLTATDADGDALTYSVVSTAKLGTVLLNAATGSFTYTPHAGSTGSDTFTFKANDGKADSNAATFNVTIDAYVSIRLEAEQGVLTAPMYMGKDSKAGGSRYIYVPNGYGTVTDPLRARGQAAYNFSVPATGSYRIWGRVMTPSTADNSFFVSVDNEPGIAWHTAIGAQNSWVWTVVKERDYSEPPSFDLSAGAHTLVIKQMEDGTKLDAVVITTNPAWIPETVYADAESGGIDGWDVFDADPAGAEITNVFDEGRNSRVIQVAGSTTDNGYRLRSQSNTSWDNSSQFVIEWSMKYGEAFVIYVEVETNKGYRYFQYEPLSYDLLGRSSQIRLGLGSGAKDGQWHTVVRDLQADLTKAQPGTTILKVNGFSIRGSGQIDDVKLRFSY